MPEYQQLDILKLLVLSNLIDPDKKNYAGFTPIDVAEEEQKKNNDTNPAKPEDEAENDK